MKLLVVAIGGNAILPAGDPGGAASQWRRIEATCARLADLVAEGYDLAITHGNGPQVGNILVQNEESRRAVPSMPLDVCGAESQGQIGYMLQQALQNEFAARGIRKGVASVITQVRVDPADPAFARPTKPIGPFYEREDEILVKRAKGWKFIVDPRGGYRRVVPSPLPLEIVEKDIIRKLLAEDGHVVIAAGGGGIPVVRIDGRLVGVEAVIDKDLASAVLAKAIGCRTLLIVTDVSRVAVDFGRPTERPLDRVTLAEAKKYYADGQFPAGSMGPKVEAIVRFLEGGGTRAIVTNVEDLAAALAGRAGTVFAK